MSKPTPPAERPKLTRNELATARANARLWATRKFESIAHELREMGINDEQRAVYLSELTGYLRYCSPDIVAERT